MIKKMIVGGVLIVIGFFLILFQLNTIDQIKEKDEMVKIYTLSEDINYGELITENKISEMYIRKSDNKEQYISKLDSINYYINRDKKENSILLKSDISKEKPVDKFLKDNKNNIITLSLGIEEANAWDFKEFDEIDLYFVSNFPDKENVIYENVVVYKIVNSDPYNENYSDLQVPQYVSLLVPKENSYEILSNKKYGRFEIIIN